jgi:hypothetical protein
VLSSLFLFWVRALDFDLDRTPFSSLNSSKTRGLYSTRRRLLNVLPHRMSQSAEKRLLASGGIDVPCIVIVSALSGDLPIVKATGA